MISYRQRYFFFFIRTDNTVTFLRKKINVSVFKNIVPPFFVDIPFCSKFLENYRGPIIPTYFWEISKELWWISSFNFFKSLQRYLLSTAHLLCPGCLFTVCIPSCAFPSSTVEEEISPCSQAFILKKSPRKDMFPGLIGQKYVKHTPAGSHFLLTKKPLANSQLSF